MKFSTFIQVISHKISWLFQNTKKLNICDNQTHTCSILLSSIFSSHSLSAPTFMECDNHRTNGFGKRLHLQDLLTAKSVYITIIVPRKLACVQDTESRIQNTHKQTQSVECIPCHLKNSFCQIYVCRYNCCSTYMYVVLHYYSKSMIIGITDNQGLAIHHGVFNMSVLINCNRHLFIARPNLSRRSNNYGTTF